jgi:hypothetical protein
MVPQRLRTRGAIKTIDRQTGKEIVCLFDWETTKDGEKLKGLYVYNGSSFEYRLLACEDISIEEARRRLESAWENRADMSLYMGKK